MNCVGHNLPEVRSTVAGESRISTHEGWTLREYAEVTSTNLVAANLTAWNAVRADTQTAGRGRFQRSWVSDAGGLWLSAVLPVERNSPNGRALPLAAGVAICEALRVTGGRQLRLRWPNDVLVQNRKLAGLLIDQFKPGLAVAGIGINVFNRPEDRDARLAGQVARLSELILPVPTLLELTLKVLASLKAVWTQLETSGPEALLPRVNALWEIPRTVELDLDGTAERGEFTGVDAGGRLHLRVADGTPRVFEPHEVRLLRDIP